MFRVPLTIAFIFLIAFGGATASAILALKATVGFGAIEIGPWTAWPEAQTETADPYAKAHRARTGLLLLGGAEGLRFTADLDNEGHALVTRCDYTLSGVTPPARFWTLHAIDEAGALLLAGDGLPSTYHSQNVLKNEDGTFVITASGKPKTGNWLATGNKAVPYQLVLTLFDTPTAGSSRLVDLQMPQIKRGTCHDG